MEVKLHALTSAINGDGQPDVQAALPSGEISSVSTMDIMEWPHSWSVYMVAKRNIPDICFLN
jgi:hypothetical protein